MKRSIMFLVLVSVFLISGNAEAVKPPEKIPIFDIDVFSDNNDLGGGVWEYDYELYYADYNMTTYQMRGISHWWLEINCAHPSIIKESIWGYSSFEDDQGNDVEYDWLHFMVLGNDQTPGYTDWVIKWEVPQNVTEIPKDPGSLIGYFGYNSTQGPTLGYWGGKGGGNIFDTGNDIDIPLSTNCTRIPEPTSLILFGIGLLGLEAGRRARRRS